MSKKLTRREVQLIRHAVKHAIDRHESEQHIVIVSNGRRVIEVGLAQLRHINTLRGLPPVLRIELSLPWP